MAEKTLYDERALLQLIGEGDRTAFRLLYDRYWNDIYHLSLSFLKSPEWSQDVIQDVFIKIWEKRAKLPEIDNFKSYLFIITRNELISAIRRKVRSEALKERYQQRLPDQFVLPDQSLALNTLEQQVMAAIAQLPDQQQKIFLMTREHGLSHDEVAAQLGLARKTVANTVTKILNHVRNYLLTQGNDLVVFVICVLMWI